MYLLVISLPLISGISILGLGRYLGKKGVSILSISSIFISVLISIRILIEFIRNNTIIKIEIGEWINLGIIKIPLEFIYDKESIIMILLISTITFVVITYSIWYMENDAHISRFISELLIFSVTMFLLVSSNNFFLLFAGWETVGIMSYLLINFWYNSFNSNKSAFKAILYNKIGDIGYILGLTILINLYYNTNIKNLLIDSNYDDFFNLFFLFFILAAIAKSAQIFLHCWLGDAMAGPTPVSALLHAATMVTAGVFLLIRLNSYFFIADAGNIYLYKYVILIIGGLTILFGGFSSLGQYDIKKLIAFSTCSQIGYMFINNGFFSNTSYYSSDISTSGLFHLFTHGFFKALLFLSAGILIHNFFNDQDIRKYGSFLFKFPISYIFFLFGSLSIISFPFLSGFYSKENIINNSFTSFHSLYLPIFLILGALLTNIYSFKLLFYSFFYNNNLSKPLFFTTSPNTEIPYLFIVVFFILLFGSSILGYFSTEFFISPGISPYGIDHEFFPGHSYIFFLPFFFIFIVFVIFFFSKFNIFSPFFYFYKYFLIFFNRRAFFDTIFNFFFAYPTLLISSYSFKVIDRGFLELFGPLGLFRFFYYFFHHFNLSSQFISNINFLFLYFFLSFLPFGILLFYQ